MIAWRRQLFLAIVMLLTIVGIAIAQTSRSITITVTSNTVTAFTPLHTYFISPTGNDNNAGTQASPWATTNHPTVCGDVYVALPGSYTTQFANLGNTPVTGCPSTTGGINNTGGIYFAVLLCGGADLEACPVVNSTAGLADVGIFGSNWAVEGFKVTTGAGGPAFGMVMQHPSTGTKIHHGAFINNIIYNAGNGAGTGDCPGGACNHNINEGSDYFASVGNIAQNAAHNGFCVAAFDDTGLTNVDTTPGTHVLFYGNFALANNNGVSFCNTDQESFMLDTPDAHGFSGLYVLSNNIGVNANRFGWQLIYQFANQPLLPTVKVYNNTFYNNLLNTGGDFGDGQINLNTIPPGGTSALPLTIVNNISYTPLGINGSGQQLYAGGFGGSTWTDLTLGGTGAQNIFFGAATSCVSTCDTTTAPISVVAFNGNGLGINTYTNPNFANTADLENNRLGVPNCTGSASTTACMGAVIADLQASCAGCAGKGYQPPSMACSNTGVAADFPVWLKGIVYLHWTGTGVVQNHDLVTTPCGL